MHIDFIQYRHRKDNNFNGFHWKTKSNDGINSTNNLPLKNVVPNYLKTIGENKSWF